MFWSIYEWLWPLFESCTGEQALALHYSAPIHVTDGFGNTLYNSYGIAIPHTACICPTPIMNVLMALALVGVLAIGFSLIGSLISMLRPSRRRPDPLLKRFVENLDNVSNDYLNSV